VSLLLVSKNKKNLGGANSQPKKRKRRGQGKDSERRGAAMFHVIAKVNGKNRDFLR